jgi:hypothetical protein
MHIKIINTYNKPQSNYKNNGSCSRTINYLKKEAIEKNTEVSYFNNERDNISEHEVQYNIDNNIKGVKQEDEKFFSLVISPSSDELEHLGNDREKIKQYVRKIMDNYAENFHLKNGNITSENIVYYATIHSERKYKFNDKKVKNNNKKIGEKKKGNNLHIHIIVSARDKEQKITLNPIKSSTRFSIDKFTQKNCSAFSEMFDYKKTLDDYHNCYNYRVNKEIENRIKSINKKHSLHFNSEYYIKNVIDIPNKRKLISNLIVLAGELNSGKYIEFCKDINQDIDFKDYTKEQYERFNNPNSFVNTDNEKNYINEFNAKLNSFAEKFLKEMEQDITLFSKVDFKKRKKRNRGLSL